MDFTSCFPDDLILSADSVSLRKMRMEDIDAYRPLAHSKDIWTYFAKDLSIEEELQNWVKDAIEDHAMKRRMPFTIEKNDGTICGSTSLGNISFYDHRMEIGWTWLGEPFRGTGINRQAKFCLLQYAFDVLNFERVEIKTDNLNERSKNALIKIGAKPEGVFRSHMLMFNNRRRDSAYFSILKQEWPELRDTVFNDLRPGM